MSKGKASPAKPESGGNEEQPTNGIETPIALFPGNKHALTVGLFGLIGQYNEGLAGRLTDVLGRIPEEEGQRSRVTGKLGIDAMAAIMSLMEYTLRSGSEGKFDSDSYRSFQEYSRVKNLYFLLEKASDDLAVLDEHGNFRYPHLIIIQNDIALQILRGGIADIEGIRRAFDEARWDSSGVESELSKLFDKMDVHIEDPNRALVELNMLALLNLKNKLFEVDEAVGEEFAPALRDVAIQALKDRYEYMDKILEDVGKPFDQTTREDSFERGYRTILTDVFAGLMRQYLKQDVRAGKIVGDIDKLQDGITDVINRGSIINRLINDFGAVCIQFPGNNEGHLDNLDDLMDRLDNELGIKNRQGMSPREYFKMIAAILKPEDENEAKRNISIHAKQAAAKLSRFIKDANEGECSIALPAYEQSENTNADWLEFHERVGEARERFRYAYEDLQKALGEIDENFPYARIWIERFLIRRGPDGQLSGLNTEFYLAAFDKGDFDVKIRPEEMLCMTEKPKNRV